MHHRHIEIANNLLKNMRIAEAERDRMLKRLPEITKEIDEFRQRCLDIGIDLSDHQE